MKSETKNWPHKIVDFLYKRYSETWTELNRFFYSELKLEKHNTTHKDKIRELLDQLEEKGYLQWIANKMNDQNQVIDPYYRGTFKEIKDGGLEAARIEARLTLDGLDYAIGLERERQKHTIYKWATPSGALFAFLAFSISLLTYLRGCNAKADDPPPKVEVGVSAQPQSKKSSEEIRQPVLLHVEQRSETNLPKVDTPTAKPK